MLTAWLLIGVALFVITIAINGTSGYALLPLAFLVWVGIGILLFIGWLVTGTDDECTPERAGTAYCVEP